MEAGARECGHVECKRGVRRQSVSACRRPWMRQSADTAVAWAGSVLKPEASGTRRMPRQKGMVSDNTSSAGTPDQGSGVAPGSWPCLEGKHAKSELSIIRVSFSGHAHMHRTVVSAMCSAASTPETSDSGRESHPRRSRDKCPNHPCRSPFGGQVTGCVRKAQLS